MQKNHEKEKVTAVLPYFLYIFVHHFSNLQVSTTTTTPALNHNTTKLLRDQKISNKKEKPLRSCGPKLVSGKMPCCNTYSPDDFAAQKAAGFQGITMKSDLDLLFDRGTNLLSKLKEI